MTIIRQTSQGQMTSLLFGQHAVAASQTNVQIPISIGEKDGAVDGIVAPFNGYVVAITASTSAAATAGSLTIGATVGGTEDADTTLTVTTATDASLIVPRGKARFAAGDRIGCEITTSGTWDATTADLAVIVYVMYDVVGI